ncbi:MAG TPA: histidine kinase, partial [Pilimelia sp.]|nr:histidine kinase [Pilimelia sp.]
MADGPAVVGWAVRRAALPALAAAVQLGGTLLAARHQPQAKAMDVVGAALLLTAAAALWWVWRRPAAVLVVAFVATSGYLLLPYPRGPVYLAEIVALVACVAAGRRAVAYAVLAAGLLTSAWPVPALLGRESPSLFGAAGLAAWLGFLAAIGELIRYRRALAEAERQRRLLAARAQQDELERRAMQERLHIARDLHDVLGHHLSVINVQSSAGLQLLSSDPDRVSATLVAVRDASRRALLDVQAFLDSLQRPGQPAPHEPAPSIRDLESLLAPARAAGVPVTATVVGECRAVPAAIDLAACRVLQEALTNVIRHAGQVPTSVRVAYGPDTLGVLVENEHGPT